MKPRFSAVSRSRVLDFVLDFVLGLVLCVSFAAGLTGAAAQEVLFKSTRITPAPPEYTGSIEGPAVDADGNLYVVNFHVNGTIGKLPAGATKSQLFTTLPAGSIGSGIRFDRDGRMYVADFKKNNVFVVNHGETQPHVYFHSAAFHEPNDLAIAPDGTLYASDPQFLQHKGQVWRIVRQPDGTGKGVVMSSPRQMGATNGIDLSPDGATLYVSESDTRQVWAYQLDGDKLLAPKLLRTFDAAGIGRTKSELDGLRTDIDGKIFVARPNAGAVSVLNPDGSQAHADIAALGTNPSNLTFGGPDGKTVFVTQVDGRFIEFFRVDRPGREPCQHFSC
jgi:sugar lactone lactonase YvrE